MIRKIFTILFVTLFVNISTANAKEINVDVNGLVCEFCAVTIEKNFMKRSEVEKVKVNLSKKKVFLIFKVGENISDQEIIDIIKNNGYNVVKINR